TPVFPRRFFQCIMDVFRKNCEVAVVMQGDEVISGVLTFYFRDRVMPYYGGGTPKAREVAGNDFMYWELMRRAGEKGYTVFDFGRSKRGTGSYAFKQHWGFEATPLFYEYNLIRAGSIPAVNPLNPKYRAAIAIWKRLPLPIANVLGPYISR